MQQKNNDLKTRLEQSNTADLAEEVSEEERIYPDAKAHREFLNQAEAEDDYWVGKTLKEGMQWAIKAIALCLVLGVLLAFLSGAYLLINYVLDIGQDPAKTESVLKKLFEWSGVLLSGLFLQGALKKFTGKK